MEGDQTQVALGEPLSGVFCTSTTSCSATGSNRSGGVVIDIHQACPGAPTANTAAALTGIACDSRDCLAVGGQPSEHDGVLLGLSLSGKATSMRSSPAVAVSLPSPRPYRQRLCCHRPCPLWG